MRWRYRSVLLRTCIFLVLLLSPQSLTLTIAQTSDPQAKYIILMIGDGQGSNQLLAARQYAGSTPAYRVYLPLTAR